MDKFRCTKKRTRDLLESKKESLRGQAYYIRLYDEEPSSEKEDKTDERVV